MRGALLRQTDDETVEVRDDLEPISVGATDVQVRIEATGICHSDLSAMNGTLPQPAPAVLGHEGAGVVEAVGEGVTAVAMGDHVIVAWSPPCGTCRSCVERRQPNLCVDVQFSIAATPRFTLDGQPIFGMAGTGTWAESMVLPQQAVVKIDDDIPFDVASLIGCGVMTGVGAVINTAKVRPGSSVVVFGCGGVGISAIQGARIAGASVILAVDLVDAKLEDAVRFGATHACKPEELPTQQAQRVGDGFDYAFEAIGLTATMRTAYDATRRGGTTCIVGAGRSDQMVSFSAFELFFNEKTVVGSYYGSADVRSDFHRLLGLWRAGRLDLEGMISRRLKLDDINDGLDALRRGEVIRQVVLL